MKKLAGWTILALALLLAPGCGGDTGETHDDAAPAAEPEVTAPQMRRLNVILEGRSESTLTGIAMFVQSTSGQVSLQLNVENTPPGKHAVHLHETGDCSAPDASSAGGHWNPSHEDHGKWGAGAHHLGDIGNIEVGENGEGSLTLDTDRWSIGTGADNDILGKAVIVHADADDFTSQPTGNAGGRIGCGVISE